MTGEGTEHNGHSAARHTVRRVALYVLAILVTPVLVFPAVWLAWILHDVPFPTAADIASQRVIVLQTSDGRPLFNRNYFRLPSVSAENMPAVVADAVLSIEDRRFYEHGAIDFRSIARAFKQNFDAGRVVAGGSTITQQLAKILFLSPQRTYKRKIQEIALASWLEIQLSKNEILTDYLNNVYLGSGAIGFPAAAKLYFGKSVAALNLPEAAMLAGMINAPTQDDPFRDLPAARRRAAAVLDAMVANGKLSPEAGLVAKLHPATPNAMELSPLSSGWFADWVHNNVAAVTPANSGTVQVRTTLDPRLQKAATDIVKSALATYGAQKHVTQAALVAMRPDGAVVAMIGGRSYADSQFNRAVQAKRQPGSAFKLFDYYAALRQGFSPHDQILDAPVDIAGWRPKNYEHRYQGQVTLADAFADSLNDATVRLSQEVGLQQVIAAARDLGLQAKLGHNPSLVLGTADVSLLDLTSAYASVRAGVAPVTPWAIVGIRTGKSPRFLPVGHADQPQHSLGQYQSELIDLLQGVVEHGTGRRAALKGFAAGKTGTTQDDRDAWFIGFDDSLVVGVWVGNDDHSPMKGVAGGTIPAMIWKNFMDAAATSTTTAATNTQPQPSEPSPQHAVSVATTQSAQCDVHACEQHYESFRASDCTYQPYSGPRQYCAR